MLLDVLEPTFQRDPPDSAETTRRASAAAARYPGDAELVFLPGWLGVPAFSPTRKLEAAERCLALDPLYADCHQGKADSLARLGRTSEAFQAWERCVDASPASNDCIGDRLGLYCNTGQCAKMEEDARRLIATDRQASGGYFHLAAALHAQGRGPAATGAAWEQGWSRLPNEGKALTKRFHDMRLAFFSGRFQDAEESALARSREVAGDTMERPHRGAANTLVNIYFETGQLAEMGKVADEYLARRDAWIRPVVASPLDDVTLWFLQAKLLARLISREEYVAQRSAWIRAWEARLPPEMRGFVRFRAYAETAWTADGAVEAVQAMSELEPMIFYGLWAAAENEGVVGAMYALAGRPREALPHLERAVAACDAYYKPLQDTYTHFFLGMAREGVGDKKGACAAYKVVLDRWGDAKPRSVTADDARAKAKALGCAG
jgi:serine/threonine-protein kinase